MSDMQRAVITIAGTRYPITTAEEPVYVEDLGREIDRQVKQLIGDRMTVNEAMVLLCLHYLDSYRKSEKSADHLRGQIAEYLEEAAKARAEAGEARKEIGRLESRIKGGKGVGMTV